MKQDHIPLAYCFWSVNQGDGPGFLDASRYELFGMNTGLPVRFHTAINREYRTRHPQDRHLLFEGEERHVPNEETLEQVPIVETAYAESDIDGMRIGAAMRTPNHHHYSIYRAVTSDVADERDAAEKRLRYCFEVAKAHGVKTIVLWNGAEKYNDDLDVDFHKANDRYLRMLEVASDLAIEYDMFIAVEGKPFEPENLYMQNSGYLNTLLLMGLKKGRLTMEQINRIGANDELGHLVMNNLCENQTVAMIDDAGELFYIHLNRQYERGMQDSDHPLELTPRFVKLVNTLSRSETFSNPSDGVTRFAGLDFQFPHGANIAECLKIQYSNGLTVRLAEEAARQVDWDHVYGLQEAGRFREARTLIREPTAEAVLMLEREIRALGRDGGVGVPKSLEGELRENFDRAMADPKVRARMDHMAPIRFGLH
ncbi:MAG: hypothetical protein ABH879_05835 [archaeon]